MSQTRLQRVLIANRGEIAVRIARSARRRGMHTVAVLTAAEQNSLLAHCCDEHVLVATPGVQAYLDAKALAEQAVKYRCDCLHPGYGFLAESPTLAQACTDAGLHWIGPDADHLELLGDKSRARQLAQSLGVPVLPGTTACDLDQALDFARQHGPMMVKAVAGGGGRGMRKVLSADALPPVWRRCASEALAAFGDAALYAEKLLTQARHIEVQILGDGRHAIALGDRDCSIQRRQQKLVELAPSPFVPASLRQALHNAAIDMATSIGYRGLCTFEFLIDLDPAGQSLDPGQPGQSTAEQPPWYFLEANPRIQVEHTITEAVTGLDLVELQFQVAEGKSLQELGFSDTDRAGRLTSPRAQGWAAQWRIYAETTGQDLTPKVATGLLAHCQWPTGSGVRIDSHVQAGHQQSADFDSLIGKLIVLVPGSPYVRVNDAPNADAETSAGIGMADDGWDDQRAQLSALWRSSRQALLETSLQGLSTNLVLLQCIANAPELGQTPISTAWLESDPALLQAIQAALSKVDASHPTHANPATGQTLVTQPSKVAERAPAIEQALQQGAELLRAPMAAKVVSICTDCSAGVTEAVVLSAMKMEHVLELPAGTRQAQALVAAGDYVEEGQALLLCWRDEHALEAAAVGPTMDLNRIRPDLQGLLSRLALVDDAARPQAIAKRHAQGGRSARENVADLCDPESFIEYGALTYAAQRRRRSVDDLMANTPADGLITGIGTVNGAIAGPARGRCAVMAYDFTVLAGTQGWRNHQKTDRILHIAHEQRLPVVLFAEGGGGRPGDVDMPIVAGLHTPSFRLFAALKGKVPVVSIVHGRCFAGNAALAGCADLIIATRRSNLGMGGPAMIEGGGLGIFSPEQIGPAQALAKAGVISLLVDDEAAAVAASKRYLSYFQCPELDAAQMAPHDNRLLRHLIPENRVRAYDIHAVIQALADPGSVLELKPDYGLGIVTALVRIEGLALGLIANNPRHLGGAIDAPAADKAAAFMTLCNDHGLPMLSLCDTPGFMVGPDAETQAQVRHSCAMFTAAAALNVPRMAVVIRKGYGLGAQAMAFGSFEAPLFTISWPTGEFGGMGLEGAVKLGYRKELEAISDLAARQARFEQLVAMYYEAGSALNMAAHLELDAVIDPADTRAWIVRGLRSAQGR